MTVSANRIFLTKRALLSIAFAAFFAPAALASASTLSESEIRATIADKRVTLSTSFGSFPLTYRSDSTVSGDGTGSGLARFYNPKETGKWWVKNDRLCQRFPTWYDGKPLCFSLTKLRGNKLKWVRQDGYSGTATIR